MCDLKRIRLIVKSKTALLLCFSLLMIGPLESHASVWGDEETIYLIKDVSITGSDNEKLCLAFKMTQTNFLIPLWFSRDGYVLGVKDGKDCGQEEPPYSEMGFWKRIPVFLFDTTPNTEYFYPLTDAEIKSYQKSGLLDDPLPEFKQTFVDRFIFEMIAAVFFIIFLCWLGIKRLYRRPFSN
jgi:hypothetical protein